MSLSCDSDGDDFEIAINEWEVYSRTKTARCCECGAEIGPGHEHLRVVMVDWHEDGPFDELDEETKDVMLEDASEFLHCTKCGHLADSLWDSGLCTEFGQLWTDYIEWLEAQGKSLMTAPKAITRLKRQIRRNR